MLGMLAHRGPDDRAMHIEPGAGLAHARLSVTDPAGGRQPLSNEDGSLWITFNGEIYDYSQLRAELCARGHRFRTQCDTEVLLHLFEDEGPDVVERLNGQWAFAIWDTRSRSLFASRDPLGVRPLYYTVVDGAFLFASEIKALFAHPRVPRAIDVRGLDNIFTFWSTLPPRTIFRGIHELPPGHSLTWRDGRLTVSRYWRQTFPRAGDEQPADDDSGDRLTHLLDTATRRRLQADVPVGAYLSGGLDSSVIRALAARDRTSPLATFSLAFEDTGLDERAYQRQVAAQLGSDHHELACSSAEIGRVLPEVVWHAEAPLLRTGPAPLYLLARSVRDHGCKVVLTGEGADEMFGGYDIFKEAKIRRFWARQPASAGRASLLRRLYPYLPALQRQPAANLQAAFQISPEDLRNPLFSHLPRWRLTARLKMFFSDAVRSDLAGYDGYAEMASRLPTDYDTWDPFCQSQYLETTTLLSGYLLSSQGDRMAMAHGVECRYPFLDPDVVRYASTLPPTRKMKALNEKYILKRMARGLVPAAVLERPKQPYRAPQGHRVLAHDTTGYLTDLLSPERLRRDGLFDADAVGLLLRKCRSAQAISVKDDMAVVGVLSTQLLVDQFMDRCTTESYGYPQGGTAHVHRR